MKNKLSDLNDHLFSQLERLSNEGMSAEDVRLVQDSLPAVRSLEHPTASRFYENLFTLEPDLRGLFREEYSGATLRDHFGLRRPASTLRHASAEA